MLDRSKILYICHRIPYPPTKGDKIRSYNEVRYLAEHHRVDLACLVDDPADWRYLPKLERLCRRVCARGVDPLWGRLRGAAFLAAGKAITTGYFYDLGLQREIDRWVAEEDYDVIVCFSSTMAEYVFRSRALSRGGRRPRLVMDFCDVDSEKWRQYSRRSGFPMSAVYRLEFKRLLAFEGRINAAFDRSVFISDGEAELFRRLVPRARGLSVVPNGVDHRFFRREAAEEGRCEVAGGDGEGPVLLFTGAMDYHANVDGVVWFCEEILPRVRETVPSARFFIVGSNPHPKVRALGELPGVGVTGFVADIRPYYAMADLSVIPLRLARGVQNKVLEAMAMGNAVVSTRQALEGIGAESGAHLLVADTPEGFARRILELLTDEGGRGTLGRRARRFVVEAYDWDTNMRKLSGIVTAGNGTRQGAVAR